MSLDPIPFLDLKPQHEGRRDELRAAFESVLDSGAFIQGPHVKEFEAKVADHLETKHAIGVNSGTDALVLALRALDIGPGDEVITTPFTFFATPESISLVGAKPIFVDIDPVTYNLDAAAVKAAVTEKTKAILPVHLYGHSADMGEIMKVAEEHGLKVVEDVAQAFGTRYQGTRVGTIGDFGTYSFFPSKTLGCLGDGGLVTTNDDELAAKIRMLHKHGARKKYFNEVLGYNSRLDTLQAAFLLVKLPHSDTNNAGRKVALARYNEMFAEMPQVQTPRTLEYSDHVGYAYTIRVPEDRREAIQAALKADGIASMLYYPVPCHKLPIYDGQYGELPEAERAGREVMSLPIWPTISEETQRRVVESLRAALA